MKKKIIIFIALISVFFLIFIGYRKQISNDTDIENNKYQTIGRVYKFNSNRSFDHYYFEYYYNSIRYTNYQDISNSRQEESVNRYYHVDLSSKDAENSKIILDEEVTDSTKIVNAGFEYK